MIQPVFFVGDDGRVRMLARTGTELLSSGNGCAGKKGKLSCTAYVCA